MTFIEYNQRMETMVNVVTSLAELSKSIEADFNYKYPNFFRSSIA